MTKTQFPRFLVSLIVFIAILVLWAEQTRKAFSPAGSLSVVIGGVLLVFPCAWVGRKLLDARPTADRAAWVNVFIHLALVFLLGIAIVEAIKVCHQREGSHMPWDYCIPIPMQLGKVLFVVTGAMTLVTVLNLALRGLGAPFAIALSQRLAVDWLYAWTRNPMVLATLMCLMSLGLLFRSVFFVLWILLLVTPAWLFTLKVYEERELEIRFGESYLKYKAKTSFLWPRKPKA